MRLKEQPQSSETRKATKKNNSAAMKVPKNTMLSIILQCMKFGTTRTPPGSTGPDKLSNQGRGTLVREVTKNLMATLAELQRSCVEMGEASRRTTIA